MPREEVKRTLVEEAIKQHLELCIDDYLGMPNNPETHERIRKDALAAIHSVMPVESLDINIVIDDITSGEIAIFINYKENKETIPVYEPIEDNLGWFVDSI